MHIAEVVTVPWPVWRGSVALIHVPGPGHIDSVFSTPWNSAAAAGAACEGSLVMLAARQTKGFGRKNRSKGDKGMCDLGIARQSPTLMRPTTLPAVSVSSGPARTGSGRVREQGRGLGTRHSAWVPWRLYLLLRAGRALTAPLSPANSSLMPPDCVFPQNALAAGRRVPGTSGRHVAVSMRGGGVGLSDSGPACIRDSQTQPTRGTSCPTWSGHLSLLSTLKEG